MRANLLGASERCDCCEEGKPRDEDHLQREDRTSVLRFAGALTARPRCTAKRERILVCHVGERHRVAGLIYERARGRDARFCRLAAAAGMSSIDSRSATAWLNSVRAVPGSPTHRARVPIS